MKATKQVQLTVLSAPPADVAWLRDVPLFTWIDIPNGKELSTTPGMGKDPAYMADEGLPVPTPAAPNVTWPANKLGQQAKNYFVTANWYTYAHDGFAGPVLQDGRYSGKPSSLIVQSGDSAFPSNSCHRFVFGVDAPYWELAVQGEHYLNMKNGIATLDRASPRLSDHAYVVGECMQTMTPANKPTSYRATTVQGPSASTPPAFPGTAGTVQDGGIVWTWLQTGNYPDYVMTEADGDLRGGSFMGGTPRSGHYYMDLWGSERDNQLISVRRKQMWAGDTGQFYHVHRADLTTKRWIDDHLAPAIAEMTIVGLQSTSDQPWRHQHPITEDIWTFVGMKLGVLRMATKLWEALWTKPSGISLEEGVPAINWEEEYLLVICKLVNNGAVSYVTFPTVGPITGYQELSLTGPAAAELTDLWARWLPDNTAGCGMTWVPELHKFAMYTGGITGATSDSGLALQATTNTIFTFERSGNTLIADRLPMNGTPFRKYRNSGGVLSCLRYVPQQKGLIYRSNTALMHTFMRVA